MPKTSKEKIALEYFVANLENMGMTVHREFVFHPTRKWRFDYAIKNLKLAIEYEGGVFVKGGHVRGVIYGQNCEKYNAAQIMGWKVLRFTAPMVRAKQHEAQIFEALNDYIEEQKNAK